MIKLDKEDLEKIKFLLDKIERTRCLEHNDRPEFFGYVRKYVNTKQKNTNCLSCIRDWLKDFRTAYNENILLYTIVENKCSVCNKIECECEKEIVIKNEKPRRKTKNSPTKK
jgi:hypothetical protein